MDAPGADDAEQEDEGQDEAQGRGPHCAHVFNKSAALLRRSGTMGREREEGREAEERTRTSQLTAGPIRKREQQQDGARADAHAHATVYRHL